MQIGIGVGRNTHTLVLLEQGAEKEAKELFLPNSLEGVERVVKLAKENGQDQVVFLGNYRWATPFAYALQQREITPFYYPLRIERGKRGRVGSVSEMLLKVVGSGIRPRPFFKKEPARIRPKEELPTSYRLALEYLDITNEIRELKHHLLDCLSILFPEVVRAGKTTKLIKGQEIKLPVPEPQPPDIFTKKMRLVLENPNPYLLVHEDRVPEEVRVLALDSLGRMIPRGLWEKTLADHRQFLIEYDRQLKLKQAKMKELKTKVAPHRLMELFGEGDIITVLTAFLGWRAWPNWRELRRFCGLDVTRLDSQGKPHISRVRPQIRQYLYLFATRTNEGKKITAGVKGRVKRIERVLKFFWKEELKHPVITI